MEGPVRFAEKTNRNTVPINLLREKTLFRLKNQAEKYETGPGAGTGKRPAGHWMEPVPSSIPLNQAGNQEGKNNPKDQKACVHRHSSTVTRALSVAGSCTSWPCWVLAPAGAAAQAMHRKQGSAAALNMRTSRIDLSSVCMMGYALHLHDWDLQMLLLFISCPAIITPPTWRTSCSLRCFLANDDFVRSFVHNCLAVYN